MKNIEKLLFFFKKFILQSIYNILKQNK